MTNLKILSFGAGAIGTYIGGSLSLVGEQVVFIEQPAVAGELAGGDNLPVDLGDNLLDDAHVAGQGRTSGKTHRENAETELHAPIME